MLFRLWRRNDGLIYFLLIYPIRRFMHVFYRKIYFHDYKFVPNDKPVLLALNHPTAFMDPLFMCAFLDGPIYNMTRGDIFAKPFFRKLLESCNMFPVYRSKEGYTSRDKNDATFEFCQQKLSKKHQIVIFVEGEHHKDWRIRKLQKGIARVTAFSFEKGGVDDLLVIPIGLSFLRGDVFRDEVMVNVGKPLPIQNYLSESGNLDAKGQNTLLADIHGSLKKLSFHLEHGEDLLASRVLQLYRNSFPEKIFPIFNNSTQRFDAQKAILEKLNALPETELLELKTKVDAYFEALKREKLPDFAICQPNWAGFSWLVFLIVFAVPALAGWLAGRPIAPFAKHLTRKFVKKPEFKSSVMFGSALLLGLLFYGFLLLAALFSLKPVFVLAALTLPLIAWFSVIYREIFLRWKNARQAMASPNLETLKSLRREATAFN